MLECGPDWLGSEAAGAVAGGSGGPRAGSGAGTTSAGLSPARAGEHIYGLLATACGYSYPVIDAMTLLDVEELTRYWIDHPPLHLMVAAYLGARQGHRQADAHPGPPAATRRDGRDSDVDYSPRRARAELHRWGCSCGSCSRGARFRRVEASTPDRAVATLARDRSPTAQPRAVVCRRTIIIERLSWPILKPASPLPPKPSDLQSGMQTAASAVEIATEAMKAQFAGLGAAAQQAQSHISAAAAQIGSTIGALQAKAANLCRLGRQRRGPNDRRRSEPWTGCRNFGHPGGRRPIGRQCAKSVAGMARRTAKPTRRRTVLFCRFESPKNWRSGRTSWR